MFAGFTAVRFDNTCTLETGVAGVDWRSDGIESCEIQDVAGLDEVNH